jgi:hypothetical protein
MDPDSDTKNSSSPFGWADTPWTVAALLGAWGVMIGTEDFFLANAFMVLAALSCVARLYKDSLSSSPRRIWSFVFGVLIIAAIVAVDIHLTSRKKSASTVTA